MFEFIRKFLRTSIPEEPVISRPLVDTKKLALDKYAPYYYYLNLYLKTLPKDKQYLISAPSYYLDLYLKTLPKDKQYLILEHCAGTLITHKMTETEYLFSYSDMVCYVKAIFLPEYPHRLDIRPY
jgi:hypothetical protein